MKGFGRMQSITAPQTKSSATAAPGSAAALLGYSNTAGTVDPKLLQNAGAKALLGS